ncbi:MAG: D-allose kinase [Candidatus Erwinia impunctatus]|nr:D-allose kinase [Culicoides impunctatus]
MSKAWLGIDIGGTSTRFLFLDQQVAWSGFNKIATSEWAKTDNPVVTLAENITILSAEKALHGVMLGLPGILNRQRNQVISLPFIPSLNNQPVAEYLAAILQTPVAMDKDVNHLMFSDLNQLPEMPQSAVGLYLGTGMGNSLWINGDFYHGANGASGEIGHSLLAGNSRPCPCVVVN